MNEFEKARAAIQEAMLQDPVIHDGMPFYLVIGPALETAMKAINTQTVSPKDFLVFSQRIELAKLFDLWASENGAAKTCDNMVTFLFAKGLLRVDEAKRLIAKERTDEK